MIIPSVAIIAVLAISVPFYQNMTNISTPYKKGVYDGNIDATNNWPYYHTMDLNKCINNLQTLWGSHSVDYCKGYIKGYLMGEIK